MSTISVSGLRGVTPLVVVWSVGSLGGFTSLAVCYSPPHIPENSGNSDRNIQTPGGIAQGLKNESEMSRNSGNSRWISGVVVVAVVAAAFTNKKNYLCLGLY